MTRLLALFVAVAAFASPAAAADRRFAIQDFDRVVVEGPYQVRLTVGAASTAIARGDAQSLQSVEVEVRGTTLRVRPNRLASNARAGAPPLILLSTRVLRGAQMVGGGALTATGARGLRVDFAVDGSGTIAIDRIDADVASFVLRGSGAITASGAIKRLSAIVQGSGSLLAPALVVDDLTLAASTSGEIALAARTTANVTAAGLGSVTIAGRPACTVRGVSAAAVRCGR